MFPSTMNRLAPIHRPARRQLYHVTVGAVITQQSRTPLPTLPPIVPVVRQQRRSISDTRPQPVPSHPPKPEPVAKSSPSQPLSTSDYLATPSGQPDTVDYRLFYHHKSDPAKKISPWHDIPLLSPASKKHGERLFHYVNEIPIRTTAKMEVSTKVEYNPIAQDIKKGKLRHFTYGRIPFNYGCIPQTWEDPMHKDPDTGCLGDNDPIDVVEISTEPLTMGGVYDIRVLGVFALIDEGETDWKVIGIASTHPQFHKVKSLADVDSALLDRIYDWFKNYKTTDGKAVNQFAFDGRSLDKTFAENVIADTHEHWKQLARSEKENKGLWLVKGKIVDRDSFDNYQ